MTVDPSVFICVSMLGRALGVEIKRDIRDLIDPMLSVGIRYLIYLALALPVYLEHQLLYRHV